MTDMPTPEPNVVLLQKIVEKRRELANYLRMMEPRSARLTNIAIVCGAISAVLTATPALGGNDVAKWLTETLELPIPIWQLLCFGAMICSIAATIATNMSKSHETTARVLKAQTCESKLEGLETLLEVGSVDTESASAQFADAIKDVPFV